jgi:hypothetical protein
METYIIQRATEAGFLVQAIEPDGAVVAELDESMGGEPRRLKDPSCNREYEDLFEYDHGSSTEREVLEPFSEAQRETRFLSLAHRAMKDYHREHHDYPASWEELGMHWAEVKHTKKDPRAHPPPGTGTSWRPLGSSLTYRLTRVSDQQYKIEAYDDRGQRRKFCDATTLPPWIPGPDTPE